MSLSNETLHSQLKQVTAELHEHVERVLNLQERLSDKPSYARVLRKLLVIHERVENAVKQVDWSDVEIDLSARTKKTVWLASDLDALGHPQSQSSDDKPSLDMPSVGAGLGCLYVIEGSTLGGRVIYGHLTKTLGIDMSNGGRFFYGYGPSTMPMWSQFLASLNEVEPGSNVRNDAVAAAQRTFQFFLEELAS